MTPIETAKAWLKCYNLADAETLAGFYHEDAINDRIADAPLKGREAIRAMYNREFSTARMQVSLEQMHEAGPWIILEWRDQHGFRGCVFLLFRDGKIVHQKSYWDNMTYRQNYDLPTSIH